MMFDDYHGMWNYWIFGMFILFFISIYVANDATKFGENGMLWALVVLFMPMMGLIFYLVIRSTWSRSSRGNVENIYQVQSIPPRREHIDINSRRGSTAVSSYETVAEPGKDRAGIGDIQFCTQCGTKNNVNASYCNSCGSKIQIE